MGRDKVKTNALMAIYRLWNKLPEDTVKKKWLTAIELRDRLVSGGVVSRLDEKFIVSTLTMFEKRGYVQSDKSHIDANHPVRYFRLATHTDSNTATLQRLHEGHPAAVEDGFFNKECGELSSDLTSLNEYLMSLGATGAAHGTAGSGTARGDGEGATTTVTPFLRGMSVTPTASITDSVSASEPIWLRVSRLARETSLEEAIEKVCFPSGTNDSDSSSSNATNGNAGIQSTLEGHASEIPSIDLNGGGYRIIDIGLLQEFLQNSFRRVRQVRSIQRPIHESVPGRDFQATKDAYEQSGCIQCGSCSSSREQQSDRECILSLH